MVKRMCHPWLPNIKTKLPHKDDLKFIEELNKVSPLSMQEHQIPIVWKKANNYNVFDRHGNRFIDFSSCIFVANVGHSNDRVCKAIKKQANDKLLHSYTFANEIRLKYLQKLTQFTGFEKAFLLSAGTEATEAACKMMREYTGRQIILSFAGAMHGKTALAWGLRERSKYDNFGINRLAYPKKHQYFNEYLESTYKEIIIDNIAGIIIESYRGWDADFFTSFFIQDLVEWANKNKILVCFDEIQSGFGRTGKKFAYEHYGVKPDLICCGKGISNGFPLSAVLTSAKIMDSCDDLSSTNSANPLACAIGLAVLEEFESKKIIEKTQKKGIIFWLLENLIKYKIVDTIKYRGMLGAVIFKDTEIADKVCLECLQKGLIVVKTGRESIKLAPPLITNDNALFKGFEILEKAVKKVSEEYK